MTKSEGIILSVNRDNQLTIKTPPKDKPKLLRGQFRVDKDNNLSYLIKEKDKWHRKLDMPDRLQFQGQWRLNSNYDLVLNLKEKGRFKRRRLILKGNILNYQRDCLVFQIRGRPQPTETKIYLLKLKGHWRSDRFNRIIFEVKKRSKPDILIFKGAWNVNEKQQVIYEYTKLKTKDKQILIFNGFWEFSSCSRLSYKLQNSSESSFSFRVSLGSPNIYPKRGTIKYTVGVGLKKRRRIRIVSLYGTWKFSRKLGLVFEMDYGGRLKAIQFGATVNLTKRDRLILMLKGKDGNLLGINLTFKYKYLAREDLEYFLRLGRDKKISSIKIGATIRF